MPKRKDLLGRRAARHVGALHAVLNSTVRLARWRAGAPSREGSIADRSGLPVSATIASGERHEVRLVDAAIEQRFTKAKPQKLIGDKAYDSAKLEDDLAAQDIQLIAPVRGVTTKRWPDGRSLRR